MGSRQHQVPHHHTALQHTVFIKAHRPHLPEHLPQGLGRHGKIIRRSRIPGGKRAVVIFQVGQVDLHPALQQPQYFHPLVPAGIIQYRDRQAFAAQVQCFQDPRQVLCGGNQVDIVRPLRLQCKENFRQPFGGDLFPLAPVADDAVLTKTQPSVHPQKNTVPEPRSGSSPLMQGSSHRWRAARAARRVFPAPQRPVWVRRSAPQRRGHSSQCSGISTAIHFTAFQHNAAGSPAAS